MKRKLVIRVVVVMLALSALYPLYKGLSATMQARHASSPGTTLDDGLVGHWTFDGADMTSTTALDKSGNSNTGTLTNMATSSRVAGMLGQGLQFDGLDDYIEVGSSNKISNSEQGTISTWVFFPESGTAGGTIFGYGGGVEAGSGDRLSFEISYDYLVLLFLDDANGLNTIYGPVLEPGKWHHVVITSSGTAYEMYVNGNPVSISGVTNNGMWFADVTVAESDMTTIGRLWEDGHFSNPFPGSLDDIRIYNRALTADEIHQLYKMGEGTTMGVDPTVDPLAEGLAGYWKFDEASGSTTVDSSVNRNNGTTTNMSSTTKWTTGKIGGALTFDGTDDYVIVPNSTALNPSYITVSAWIKTSAPGSPDSIMDRDDGASTRVFQFRVNSNSVEFIPFADGGGLVTAYGPRVVTDDNWHHVVGTWDGTTVLVYVDGVAGTGVSFAGILKQVAAGNLLIGDRLARGYPFHGQIDEARLYNRALSADEVSTLYRTTKPTEVDASLVGHWTFDGPTISGSTVYDRSGAGNNGSIYLATKTFGVLGQAMNFASWGNRVDMGDPSSGSLDFGSGDFSVSTFFKAGAFVSYGVPYKGLVAKFDASVGNSAGYGLLQNSSNQIYFRLGDGSATYNTTASGNVVDGAWHHAVGVRSGNTTLLYVDGIQVGSGTFSGSVSSGSSFYTGSVFQLGGETAFAGDLDEVSVYNRALSADEIHKMYKVGAGSKMNVDTITPDLERGLAGYWPLDNGSGVTASDLSVNGNNGTLTGGPTWSAGKIGGAVTFDGINDYITAPHSTAYNFNYNENFSVTLWVKIPATQNNTTVGANEVLTKWVNTGPYPYYIAILNQTFATVGDRGKISIARYDGTNNPYVRSATAINDNTWHHINVIKRGSTLELYIDGVLSSTATDTTTNTTTNASSLYIGEESGSAYPLTGSVDDVRIYNRALSQDEIAQLYRTTKPTQASDGLVGYWPFNGPDVTDKVYDRSGAGNNGYFVGGATTSAKTIGQVGQGLQFDGVDDYVQVDTSLPIGGTYSYSVGAWVKTTQSSSIAVVEKYSFNSQTDLYLNYVSNKASMVLADGVDVCLATSLTSVNDGKWHYILGTRDYGSHQLKIYVDGNLEATESETLCGNANTTKFTTIGAADAGANGSVDSSYLAGPLDEVRIYNRALSAQEVKQLYNAGR